MEFDAGTTGKKHKNPASLKNSIVTIQSCQCLTPKRINQDALENFFGMIRTYNFSNINPFISQFTSTFRTLLINDLSCDRSSRSNCEEVTFSHLSHWKNLLAIVWKNMCKKDYTFLKL